MSFQIMPYNMTYIYLQYWYINKKGGATMKKFNPQQYADNEMERITLRLSHKTKEELATLAQRENISLNTLIIRCIDFALKNKE